MASGTSMKGTIVANNAAINMNSGDTLEGRALSTTGAVSIDGTFAYTPVGCGSPFLTGPAAPSLASTSCYALFSSDGPVTNTGITYATGDIGTNLGLTTGFSTLNVVGAVHPIPDISTAACAADLLNVYTYLNTLNYDIELLYPAQFGNNLVLTPHTYRMNGAVNFVDTLYLDGRGNPNAVFVIQVNGALQTSTYSKVLLKNGTQARNVYWKIEGAVDINDYSVFRGTIVANNGAIGIYTGATLDGRALTTTGAINTAAITANIPSPCITTGISSFNQTTDEKMNVYPNPFTTSTDVMINNSTDMNNCKIHLFNVLGEQVLTTPVMKQLTTLKTSTLPSGIYFYKVISEGKTIQSGKLISQQ
jgi:hypothetical protein